MGWQSFLRWGNPPLHHQPSSHQSSALALETFLESLAQRVHDVGSSPLPLGLFQDFFTRLTDMLNDLRGAGPSAAQLKVPDDTPPGGQDPAPQSTDPNTSDDHSSPAPVAPQSLLDEDDSPGSEDAQDDDGLGGDEDGDDHGDHHNDDDDHVEAPEHEHAFNFRDLLDLQKDQGGTDPAQHHSLIEELVHLLQGGNNDGLSGLLAQLPMFQELAQDLRDAVQNHTSDPQPTAVTGSDDHGHHHWDHLI